MGDKYKHFFKKRGFMFFLDYTLFKVDKRLIRTLSLWGISAGTKAPYKSLTYQSNSTHPVVQKAQPVAGVVLMSARVISTADLITVIPRSA